MIRCWQLAHGSQMASLLGHLVSAGLGRDLLLRMGWPLALCHRWHLLWSIQPVKLLIQSIKLDSNLGLDHSISRELWLTSVCIQHMWIHNSVVTQQLWGCIYAKHWTLGLLWGTKVRKSLFSRVLHIQRKEKKRYRGEISSNKKELRERGLRKDNFPIEMTYEESEGESHSGIWEQHSKLKTV